MVHEEVKIGYGATGLFPSVSQLSLLAAADLLRFLSWNSSRKICIFSFVNVTE